MSDQNFSRTINIYVDSGAAQQAYNQLLKTQQSLTADVKKYTDAGKEIPEKLASKLDVVTQALDKQSKKLTGELSPNYKDLTKTVNRLTNELKLMSPEDAGLPKKRQQAEEAKKALDSYKEAVLGVGSALKKSEDDGSGFFSRAKEVAAGITLEKIGEKAMEVMKDIAKESINEAMEAQDAQIALLNDLSNVGRTDVLDSLNAEADKLAQTFKHLDNDDITKVQDKFVTFGRMSIDQINQVMPVVINYAAKSGKSLDEAANVMLKAFEGSGKALKEYGIEITREGGFTENFTKVMEQLGPRVEGAADAFSRMGKGGVQTANTSIKNMYESIGNYLLPAYNEWNALVSRVADNVGNLFKVEEDQDKKMRDIRDGMNLNLNMLQNANLSQETRKRLIQETNEKYGEYLPHLLTEKSTLSDIAEIQKEGNKALMMKMYMVAYEKEITKLLEAQKGAMESKYQLEKKYAENNSPGSKVDLSPSQLEKVNAMNKAFQGVADSIVKNTDKNVEEVKAKYKYMIESLGANWEEFQKMLDGDKKKNSTALRNDPDYNKDELKKAKEEYKKFLEEMRKMALQAHNDQVNKNRKEQEELDQKYEEVLKKEQDFHKKGVNTAEQHEKNVHEIMQMYAVESEELKKRQTKEAIDTQYENTLKGVDGMFAAVKAKQDEAFKAGLINQTTYEIAIGEIEAQHLQARADVANRYALDSKKAKEDEVALQAAADAQVTKNLTDELKRREDSRKRAAEYEKETASTRASMKGPQYDETAEKLKELNIWYAEKKRLAEENEDELTKLTADYQAKRDKIVQDGWRNTVQEIGKDIQTYGALLTRSMQAIFKAMDQSENQHLKRDKENNAAKVKNLDDQLKKKQISQKVHDKLVTQQNEEMDKKEEDLKRKQFNRNKALQIVTAIINTAAAVVQALANNPPPASYVMAAISGALGAVEIGTIAASQYADGSPAYKGEIGGQPHSSGGNPVIDPNTGRKVAELERGEAIIPKDATARNPDLIRYLLTNGRNQSLANTLHPHRQLDVARNMASIHFANGGIYGMNTQEYFNGNRGQEAMRTDEGTAGILREIHSTLRESHEMHRAIAKKPNLTLKEIQDMEYTQKIIIQNKGL